MTRSLFILTMCTALLCSIASADLRYELIDIPLPSGVTSMSVYDMGRGNTNFCASGGGAWLWNGSWTLLGDYKMRPRCVSNTGYVGGSASDSTAKGWCVTGGSIEVRTLPITTMPYGSRTAYGVNDYGLFTGTTDADIPDFGPGRTAWVYDWQTGDVTYIPAYNLVGDTSKLADVMVGRAVNNAGTVVGIAQERETCSDGFVWTASGGVESLGLVTTGSVDVYDVSENGYITGHINGTAFVKKIGDSGYVSIGIPGAWCAGGGVNDTGMVATYDSVYHDGVTEKIQSLLVNGAGYNYFQLKGINNRGWIVGEARKGPSYANYARARGGRQRR